MSRTKQVVYHVLSGIVSGHWSFHLEGIKRALH